jgi:cardiolipin synthase
VSAGNGALAMVWLAEAWDEFSDWLPYLLAVAGFVATVLCSAWVLMTKSEASSAIAWILLILFVPIAGIILFFFFGYQHVNRPLQRKRRHKLLYERPANPPSYDSTARQLRPLGADEGHLEGLDQSIARLAYRLGGYHVTEGNDIDFYHEGQPAFDAMFEAIRAAKHHVHVCVFIFQPDNLGAQFLELLAAKAKEGVEVRLLYDAMGSHRLRCRLLRPLHEAGGSTSVFLPINPLRRRLQINMRNHRKIMVVDGRVGFIGGLNIGDEYVGKNKYFGFWRDTHLRLRGPGVVDLQRVFVEDWSFAAGENLQLKDDAPYFTAHLANGPYAVQVIDSGPDRDLKTIREVTFAAILKAQKRVWIASPYFVPDAGILDALRLAAYHGLDVRFLGQFRPDKWLPQYAARYYWGDVLRAGVQVYQYTRGMMHAKVMLIDDDFASVGTANLDNRSMFLNFEVNCLIYSPQAVKNLETSFLADFRASIKLDKGVYARRPLAGRLAENACRLLSPIL